MTEPIMVPKTWDGAFEIYKNSRAVIMHNVRPYLAIVLASLVAGLIQDNALNTADGNSISVADIVVAMACILLSILLSVSLAKVVLAGLKSKKVEFMNVVRQSVSIVPNYFLMSIVVSAIAIVSLLLFIVPFFFVLPRLVLAEYFVVDKNMGPIEAIKASWAATKGHVLKVWGISGATIVMALLMITIIGIPFSVYFLFMYSAAFGVLYAFLLRGKTAK